jgi:hypothetical protein
MTKKNDIERTLLDVLYNVEPPGMHADMVTIDAQLLRDALAEIASLRLSLRRLGQQINSILEDDE